VGGDAGMDAVHKRRKAKARFYDPMRDPLDEKVVEIKVRGGVGVCGFVYMYLYLCVYVCMYVCMFLCVSVCVSMIL
jgi:hypothetical protein